jgi:hypothetical protein
MALEPACRSDQALKPELPPPELVQEVVLALKLAPKPGPEQELVLVLSTCPLLSP